MRDPNGPIAIASSELAFSSSILRRTQSSPAIPQFLPVSLKLSAATAEKTSCDVDPVRLVLQLALLRHELRHLHVPSHRATPMGCFFLDSE